MRVEVLDLADAQIQEGHSLSDFNDRLWADASHSSTETTVQLEHCKLAQDSRDILCFAELCIGYDLL